MPQFIVNTDATGVVTHYNWARYDLLLQTLAQNGVRPYWTFCCVNSASDTGSACPGDWSNVTWTDQFAEFVVTGSDTAACKRLFSLGCVAHTSDGVDRHAALSEPLHHLGKPNA